MSPIDRQKNLVMTLINENGLELWDHPGFTDATNRPYSDARVESWSMRIGNPATYEDIIVDALGEYALWCEAEAEIKAYLAEKAKAENYAEPE